MSSKTENHPLRLAIHIRVERYGKTQPIPHLSFNLTQNLEVNCVTPNQNIPNGYTMQSNNLFEMYINKFFYSITLV